MGSSASKQRYRFNFQKIWLQLASLFLAFVLFYIVRTQQVREYTRLAKIKIITAPEVLVVGSTDRVVEVTIRMPDSILSSLPAEEALMGEVDVAREQSGKIRIRLSRENFPNLDKRYSLTIHEPWMELDLDSISKKKVPIRAVLQGLPKEGLGIDRVSVSPEMVEITGPKRVLNKLEYLQTSVINIQDIDKNYSTLSSVVLSEDQSVTVAHEKINIEVIVGPSKVIRVFKAVPIEVIAPRNLSYRIESDSVEVRIQASKTVAEKVNLSSIKAIVDLNGVPEGFQDKIEIQVSAPQQVNVIQISPEKVNVVVSP
jgi:YbbR domain-containing protein